MTIPAFPPYNSQGKRAHIFRFPASVPFGMPFPGNSRFRDLKTLLSPPGLASRTVRATHARAPVRHFRLPLMPFRTYPPDRSSGPGRYIGRRERSVSRGMPFCGELWIYGPETVVFTGLMPRTIGTSISLRSIVDIGQPFMAFPAKPPHFPVSAGGHVCRRQGSIARGMPFRCKRRVHGTEAILPVHLVSGAVRAAGSQTPVADDCLPLMALAAYPPDFSVGENRNIPGSQRGVPRRVPLQGQLRLPGLQGSTMRHFSPAPSQSRFFTSFVSHSRLSVSIRHSRNPQSGSAYSCDPSLLLRTEVFRPL